MNIDNWPGATDILRWAGAYNHYPANLNGDMAMLRGRRVDTGAEYMLLGAKLERAHCAAHLKERATRRNDETLSPDLRKAMIAEANMIAFGKEPDSTLTEMWIDKNKDCVCIGYLNAAAKFLREHPMTLVEAQFTVVNRKLKYAGHPDWFCQNDKGFYELLSIKTGEMPSFAGLQEALYLLADPVDFTWPVDRYNIRRAVVQFRADGGYTYKPLTDYQDLRDAEILAAAYHIARRIGEY